MKRIDRLCRTARHEAGMAILFAAAATAAGTWAVVAALSGTLPGGTVLIVAAAIALCICVAHLRECLRVSRLAMREMEWEAKP